MTEQRIRSLIQKYGLFAAWAGTIVLFALVEPHTFLERQNITSTLSSQAVLVLLTYSLVVTLTAGEYDVSAAAVLTLSSMVIASAWSTASSSWPSESIRSSRRSG
jgi:ribose/xylose/arabinose/galactoside ABC-type transport system permease subunit